ncbi:MAG: deoxyribonuclease IV [Thermoguttaceae bacterium]
MPYFGVHESIAGGFERAVYAAAQSGFDCVQLFSKNSNQWKAKPISEEESDRFRAALQETSIRFPLIHDSYLINIASAKEDLRQKSEAALIEELERAALLGIPSIVIHPGSPTGEESKTAKTAEENGLSRIAESLDKIFESTQKSAKFVNILLETTAGQGNQLGCRFEHLAEIIKRTHHSKRLGVCIDSCHIFAAGYAITSPNDYRDTMNRFGDCIGFDRLCAFHLNDSIKGLGSRVDRHAAIGEGMIGREAFAHIVTDPRFAELPMYIETPKGTIEQNGKQIDMDVVNLQILRELTVS